MFYKSLFLALFLTSVSSAVDAQPANTLNLNSLSSGYQEQARIQLSENDVKAFIYQWFAALDHQREAGYYINRLTPSIAMTYPDFDIKSHADFLTWYKNVTDNIIWNSHELGEILVTGDQRRGWQVHYKVRWQARTAQGQDYDLLVAQRVEVVRIGDMLKIAKLVANIVEPSSSSK